MESHMKSRGHPSHPMLIVFPLGLLATATIFDVAYLVTSNGRPVDVLLLALRLPASSEVR